MDFGGEERNNLEGSIREVATASIQHTEECRMKQVNSEPGEPDCDPCLTDHIISVIIKHQLSGVALKDLLELFSSMYLCLRYCQNTNII